MMKVTKSNNGTHPYRISIREIDYFTRLFYELYLSQTLPYCRNVSFGLSQEPIIEQAQEERAILLTFLRVLFAESDMHTLFDTLLTQTSNSN